MGLLLATHSAFLRYGKSTPPGNLRDVIAQGPLVEITVATSVSSPVRRFSFHFLFNLVLVACLKLLQSHNDTRGTAENVRLP